MRFVELRLCGYAVGLVWFVCYCLVFVFLVDCWLSLIVLRYFFGSSFWIGCGLLVWC